LSPHAAYWGYQDAPDEWAGKSPDEIAPLLEQNVFDTVTFSGARNLNVREVRVIGNRSRDVGILNFLPASASLSSPARALGAPNLISGNGCATSSGPIVAQAVERPRRLGSSGADRTAARVILQIRRTRIHARQRFSASGLLPDGCTTPVCRSDYAARSHPYATTPWKLDRIPCSLLCSNGLH
jgi:hypothetical protein